VVLARRRRGAAQVQRYGRSVELLERDEQLAVLAAAHEEAAAGRGCVVLLEGEPGIGKTALITRAAVLAVTVVDMGCSPPQQGRLCDRVLEGAGSPSRCHRALPPRSR
jgi:hypothetical protein